MISLKERKYLITNKLIFYHYFFKFQTFMNNFKSLLQKTLISESDGEVRDKTKHLCNHYHLKKG